LRQTGDAMDDQERVNRWLLRHRLGHLELTPLVEARIAVRHRTEQIENRLYLTALGFLAIASVVQAIWFEREGPPMTLASIGMGYLLMNAATGLTFWLQRRRDQRIARDLHHRVTRSEAVSLAAILGGRNLFAAAVMYGGGILVGAGSAVLANSDDDRLLAGVFLVGTILCFGLATWLLTDVVRRPAIADDEPSLRADDLLRRKDACRALVPYPAALAAIVAVSSTDGSALLWVFLAYAGAAMVAWGFTAAPAIRTRVASGVRAG
jgi:FtsH-binding integral membrane protein